MLDAGKSINITFQVIKYTEGTYTVEIDEISATLTVMDPHPPTYWLYAGIVTAIIIIAVIIWLVIGRIK